MSVCTPVSGHGQLVNTGRDCSMCSAEVVCCHCAVVLLLPLSWCYGDGCALKGINFWHVCTEHESVRTAPLLAQSTACRHLLWKLQLTGDWPAAAS